MKRTNRLQKPLTRVSLKTHNTALQNQKEHQSKTLILFLVAPFFALEVGVCASHELLKRVMSSGGERVIAKARLIQIAAGPSHVERVEGGIVPHARPCASGSTEGEGELKASGPGVELAFADPVNADLGAQGETVGQAQAQQKVAIGA